MTAVPRWTSARIYGLAIILAVGFFAPARADESEGVLVVAHTMPIAILVWDASPVVGNIVIAGLSGSAGMRALQAKAVVVLGERAARMRASRIELHVQYAPSGVVGAAYQANTFANEAPLFTLRAARSLAASRYRVWAEELASGRTPAGLTVRLLGSFPQTQ